MEDERGHDLIRSSSPMVRTGADAEGSTGGANEIELARPVAAQPLRAGPAASMRDGLQGTAPAAQHPAGTSWPRPSGRRADAREGRDAYHSHTNTGRSGPRPKDGPP
jgi:hypothetical protein